MMERPRTAQRAVGLQRLDLPLAGAADALDVDRITVRLGKLPGVHSVVVNAIGRRAAILFDPARTRADLMVRMLVKIGVRLGRSYARWHLPLPGISCAACIEAVERKIQEIPGVHAARVSRATGTLTVEYAAKRTDVRRLGETTTDYGSGAVHYCTETCHHRSAAGREESATPPESA